MLGLKLPAFFPDATYGAVRCLDARDVEEAGISGLVMNAFHLNNRPGPKSVKSLGGLKAFTGFKGVILTDSGGFQLFSMIRENPSYGEIRDSGIIFRPDGGGKLLYTPEKCVQAQFQYGSDIMMALDYCTRPDDGEKEQRRAVEITVRWAKRCRDEYDKLKGNGDRSPLIFGIVQGGGDSGLRCECGERLEEIGFDGYGFGGWPLDRDGKIRLDVLQMAADAMPDGKPKYAMGLGKPEEIAACVDMGYTLFDCVIPTREARHHRLYVFTDESLVKSGSDFYRHLHIMDEKYRRDGGPISESCGCRACQSYSRAYIQHLFRVGDSLAMRLATIHNLWFYSRLMELLA